MRSLRLQEVKMSEFVFDTELLNDGHLFCPKEFALPRATFKVIVSIPTENATDKEIKLSAAEDLSDDFLSQKELDYYLSLEETERKVPI
jgi:hypothetical protein